MPKGGREASEQRALEGAPLSAEAQVAQVAPGNWRGARGIAGPGLRDAETQPETESAGNPNPAPRKNPWPRGKRQLMRSLVADCRNQREAEPAQSLWVLRTAACIAQGHPVQEATRKSRKACRPSQGHPGHF